MNLYIIVIFFLQIYLDPSRELYSFRCQINKRRNEPPKGIRKEPSHAYFQEKKKLHIFSSLAFMPRKIAKLSKNFNEQW